MPAITIRDLPEPVHDALRRIAAERRTSVEALARSVLSDLAREARTGGIDFGKLARDRAALGLAEDGPEWTEDLDAPELSRRVLGLDAATPLREPISHRDPFDEILLVQAQIEGLKLLTRDARLLSHPLATRAP